MSNKSTNRKINIWINGRQVENTFKGINNAMRKARNELANMTIGSKAYEKQTKKLKELQGILDEHRVKQGLIANGWKKIRQNIKEIAIGNFASNILTNIVDGFKSGITKVMDLVSGFEGGMTNVFTLLSDKHVDVFGDSLKDGAKEVSELGFKTRDTTKSLFDAISAGVDTAHSIDYLKEAAILAKGGVTSLSTAVDGNTTILNAYKLAISEAGNVNAAFFSAQKEGKTTVDELASSVGKAAPIAASLGISYQELLSATAALTKGGISTKESVTYLKSAFANLIKPSKDAEQILRKFNVPIGATEIKAVGLSGVLEKLNEVIKQNPDEIAKAIPSVEALTAVQALSGEGLKEYQRILKNVQTDIGENSSLQKAYKKQMESLPNVMAKAREKLNNFAITLGEKLAPYIKEILPLISGMSKRILQLIDFLVDNASAFKNIVKVMIPVVAGIKAYNVITKAQIALSAVKVMWAKRYKIAVMAVAKAQEFLNKTSKKGLWGYLLAGVTAVVAAVITFKNELFNTRESLAEFNKELIKEQTELNNVFDALRKTNPGTDERRRLINEINTKYKDYLPNLLTERSSIYEIARAQIVANDALEKNIALKHKQKAIEEEFAKYVETRAKAVGEIIELASRENKYIAGQAAKELNHLIDLSVQDGKINEKLLKQYAKKYDTEKFMEGREFTLRNAIQSVVEAYNKKTAALTNITAMYSHYDKRTEKSYQSEAMAFKKMLWRKEISEEEYEKKLDELRKKYNINYFPEEEPEKTEEPAKTLTTKTIDNDKPKKEVDALKVYKENYQQLREKILEIRKNMNLSELSEEERALEEIRLNYAEKYQVLDDSIEHLKSIEAKKGKLNDQELDLLQKFYNQKSELILLEEEEIRKKEIELANQRLEEKKKVQQQIDEMLMDSSTKEVFAITSKYKELIKKAEEHGIETIDLYKKMAKEIKEIQKGHFTETDIFGMTQEDWEKLKKDFEEVAMFANSAKNMASAFFDLQSSKEQASLEKYEANNEKKRKSLENRLNKGKISQEKYNAEIARLDKELDAKKKEIATKEADRTRKIRSFETIINTAAAIVGFLANPGGVKGVALSAMAGITGGLQLAAINREKLPRFASGKRVNEPTVAVIGDAGREIVLSNRVVNSPVYGGIADDLARVQEGKQPRFLKQPQTPNYKGMKEVIGRTTVNSVTNNTTINKVDNEALDKVKDEISEMKESVKEMTNSIKDLKYLKAIISDDQLVEHEDEKELRMKYEGF